MSIFQWEERRRAPVKGSTYQAQKRGYMYNPNRHSMLEDLDIPKYWTLAYLKLKFWDVTTWFQVEMTNSALRNKRSMDRLLRRITLLLHNAS